MHKRTDSSMENEDSSIGKLMICMCTQIIFDLTLCGQWAGAVFADQCPGLGGE